MKKRQYKLKNIDTLEKFANFDEKGFISFLDKNGVNSKDNVLRELTVLDMFLITGKKNAYIRKLIVESDLQNKTKYNKELKKYSGRVPQAKEEDLFVKVGFQRIGEEKVSTTDKDIQQIEKFMKDNNLPLNPYMYENLARIAKYTGLERYMKELEMNLIDYSFEREKEYIKFALANGVITKNNEIRDLDGIDILSMMQLPGEAIAKNIKNHFEGNEQKELRRLLSPFYTTFKIIETKEDHLMKANYKFSNKEVTQKEKEQAIRFIKKNSIECNSKIFIDLLRIAQNGMIVCKTNDIMNMKNDVDNQKNKRIR